MFKKVFAAFLLVAVVISCVGCAATSATIRYTFKVDTGDNIEVKLNAKDNYNISATVPFEITQNGDYIASGTFITASGYQDYYDAVHSDTEATILDYGVKDGNSYIFWCYQGGEWNYAILVSESTGVLLGSNVSEAAARDCFSRLTFEQKN